MNLSIPYLKIFFGNFDTLKCDIKWSVNVKVWLSENDKKKKKDNVGNKKKWCTSGLHSWVTIFSHNISQQYIFSDVCRWTELTNNEKIHLLLPSATTSYFLSKIKYHIFPSYSLSFVGSYCLLSVFYENVRFFFYSLIKLANCGSSAWFHRLSLKFTQILHLGEREIQRILIMSVKERPNLLIK